MLHIIYESLFALSFLSCCVTAKKIRPHANRNDGGMELLIFIFSTAEWIFCELTEDLLTPVDLKITVSALAYIGFSIAPVSFLLFSLKYAGILKKYSRRLLIILFFIPGFICFSAFTNHFHHLLWTHFTMSPDRNLCYHHGPLFYIDAVFSFMCIATTLAVFFTITVNHTTTRKLGLILICSLIFPWWSGILYVAGWNPLQGYNLIAFTTGFSTLFLFVAVSHAGMFTIPFRETKLVGKKTTFSDAELANKTVLITLQLWKKITGSSKIEFALKSKLWKVHTDANGWQRTQTLDKYLEEAKVPKNPRWPSVIESAEYVLSLQRRDVEPQLHEELETLLKILQSRIPA